MVFSKSITFDEEDIGKVAVAGVSSAYAVTDSDFVERLKDGNADAFDTLINRYSSDIYSLLYRITEDAEEASDLTQETFLSALKAIRSFRGEAELKTWLFRIAINHSRNRFRWWKRRRRSETVSLDKPLTADGTATLSDVIADEGETPEQIVLRRERQRRLIAALGGMPEIFRETVILCDIEGLGYEEIASALGINIGTVKSRIARGRELLRKRLSDF